MHYQTVKHTDFTPVVLIVLCLFVIAPISAEGQMDRQKQLSVKAIIERGNYFMAKQSFKEALAEYEKCLAMDPGNVTAKSNIVLLHDNWGVNYFRHNQYQDAQAEWETALQLNPNDGKAKSNMIVLKNTLARLGLDLNTESEMIKQQQSDEQNNKKTADQSAAVILDPHKQKSDNQDKNYVDQYYSSEPSGTAPGGSINKTEEKLTEPKNSTVITNNSSSAQPMVEERLSRIERKVYGRPLDKLSVTKRLEKLETDNFGQVSTAPILERVQKLNQLYPN